MNNNFLKHLKKHIFNETCFILFFLYHRLSLDGEIMKILTALSNIPT